MSNNIWSGRNIEREGGYRKMATIGDFWVFPVIGLCVQCGASIYLFRIHCKIGVWWKLIFSAFNVNNYIYLGFILYSLFLAAERPGLQPLEIYSAYYGLVFPVVNSLLHLMVKRLLKWGLDPNAYKKGGPFSPLF